MFEPEYYQKLTSDVARKVENTLFERLSEVIRLMSDLPVTMKLSQASRATGLSVSMLRTLYQEGVITGKHVGTSDNSPILIHTNSLLKYLAAGDQKNEFIQILKKIA